MFPKKMGGLDGYLSAMSNNNDIGKANGCVSLTSCHNYNLCIGSLSFMHMCMSLDANTLLVWPDRAMCSGSPNSYLTQV
jgi:hypothetical protein